jgi:hemerythrin
MVSAELDNLKLFQHWCGGWGRSAFNDESAQLPDYAGLPRACIREKIEVSQSGSMSEVLSWQPSYSVYVDALDAQHQKLFSVLEGLQAEIDRGQGRIAAERVFPQLIAYTQYHFAEEERLMEKYNFPGLAEHKLQHEILTRRVLLFKKSHDEGNSSVPLSLVLFLQEWLRNHIIGSDKQYGEFFKREGVR